MLGTEPDEGSVRGSRSTEPAAIPVSHSWKIVCREPGLCVDEQITRVLDRLRPHTARIAELARRLAAEEGQHGGGALEVVRHFNDTDQEQPPLRPGTQEGSYLFGWHLDRDVPYFLTATGAVLDIGEYDMSDPPWPAKEPNLTASPGCHPVGGAEETGLAGRVGL
ncbi:DUF4279 domain-containing protein [Streptomyces sp. NPDC059355]|uniref:DUF4279 domain-containing protein n=1 Tax=Streptomyces sp. NPDC059355 TaxID=3346811 RepID=UPI0036CCD406